MKNKAEVIKEAWIAEIGEEKYNEVKNEINFDGWLDVESNTVSFQLYSMIVLDTGFEDIIDPLSGQLMLRPKSLTLSFN